MTTAMVYRSPLLCHCYMGVWADHITTRGREKRFATAALIKSGGAPAGIRLGLGLAFGFEQRNT
jgi:hypothetical protein